MLHRCLKILIAHCVCFVLAASQGSNVTATIYVARHFEVRDHDQPTKYVFNGATRVAEVTGSLSSNPRVQRLRLYPGWNLCSLAVTGPLSAFGTGTQGEVFSAAFKWNAIAQSWLLVTSNETLGAGTVLSLKAKTTATLGVIGTYSDPKTLKVQPGSGYFSGMGLEAWSPNFPSGLSAWSHDALTKQWSEHLAGDLAFSSDLPPTLGPGQPVYVEANSTAELTVPDPALRFRYYHQDHLGSSSAITDAQGALVEETVFYPFGVPRHENEPLGLQDPYQFTQKELDRESGLHYFEARYVESSLARFATVDTKYANADRLSQADLTAFLASPQQINLYAYAQSNPLKYLDPTGLGPMDYMLPKTQEEYDRYTKAAKDAFALPGKIWDAITDKYHDVRKNYCFYPVEDCKIDWKGTYRRWFKWGSNDDDDKPKPQPAPVPAPQGGSGHGSAGGEPPGNPTETQRKVLSVIASLLTDLNDVVSDNPSNAKQPAHSTVPPHSPSPSPSSWGQPRKYLKVDLQDIHISHFQDATSP